MPLGRIGVQTIAKCKDSGETGAARMGKEMAKARAESARGPRWARLGQQTSNMAGCVEMGWYRDAVRTRKML